MSTAGDHADTIADITLSARGREERLKIGPEWLHLRLGRRCGHAGRRDQSPYRHATARFRATGRTIIEDCDPPEGWGGCYVDDAVVGLPDQTPQRGPILRFN